VILNYATIVGNSGPTGANVIGQVTSFASAIALHAGGGPNCGALKANSNGFNFSDDSSCGFTDDADKQNAGDPGLGALADNGGTTQTRLPQGASPLIDAIPISSCEANGASGIIADQRNIPRPSPAGGACDVGAVEVAAAGPAPAALTTGTPPFTG
jgi:hypothetical protein